MSDTEKLWTDVDNYLNGQLVPQDDALTAAIADSKAAGLPSIAVAPNQGKLLHLLARSINARRILEIGTLGGYSAIWMARALPAGGKLVTLEYEPKHAEVAKKNFARAGVSDRIEQHVGKALDILPTLAASETFDLVFVDADKQSNPDYFQWALKLTHVGSLILIDNVVREGKVIDANSDDPSIVGTRKCLEMIGNEKRVSADGVSNRRRERIRRDHDGAGCRLRGLGYFGFSILDFGSKTAGIREATIQNPQSEIRNADPQSFGANPFRLIGLDSLSSMPLVSIGAGCLRRRRCMSSRRAGLRVAPVLWAGRTGCTFGRWWGRWGLP